jgi:nucleoside-diphosphate-sugar epimerase
VKVLVTGATGTIGRPLVAALADAGYTVRAAVRDPHSPFRSGVEIVRLGDLAQPFDWSPLLAGVDAVMHLAGIAHIGARAAESLYDRVNHLATADLARAAARAGVGHFAFVSSIRAQSGAQAGRVLSETDAPQPSEPYGRSKLAAEEAVRQAGIGYTILRPVLVCAPGVKGNLADLLRLARSPLPLPFGAIHNRRSLVAVENLISAARFALEDPRARNETFIVADPQAVSIAEIVATCRHALGRPPRLVSFPTGPLAALFALLGQREKWDRLAGSLEAPPIKLMAAGWKPRVTTQDGLIAMAQAASPPKSGTASRSTL